MKSGEVYVMEVSVSCFIGLEKSDIVIFYFFVNWLFNLKFLRDVDLFF